MLDEQVLTAAIGSVLAIVPDMSPSFLSLASSL